MATDSTAMTRAYSIPGTLGHMNVELQMCTFINEFVTIELRNARHRVINFEMPVFVRSLKWRKVELGQYLEVILLLLNLVSSDLLNPIINQVQHYIRTWLQCSNKADIPLYYTTYDVLVMLPALQFVHPFNQATVTLYDWFQFYFLSHRSNLWFFHSPNLKFPTDCILKMEAGGCTCTYLLVG